MAERRAWTPSDRAKIRAAFRLGETKTKLARSLNLSVTRVTAIIREAEAEEKAVTDPDGLHGLTNRARSALRLGGLTSREKVLAAVNSGAIKDCPNLGPVCLVEVRQWLGCSATQGPLIDISMSVVGLRAKVDATLKERFVNGAVGRTTEEAEEAGPLLLARDCLDRIISAAIELSDLEAARQT